MRALVPALACSLAALAYGCGLFPNFTPPSAVNSVRVLAVRSSKPYARPGDVLTLDVLAVDGREDKPHPMKVFWVPVPCVSTQYGPLDCYPAFAEQLKPHVDLTQVLPSGDSLSVTVPADALGGTGGEPPLGFARMFVFEVACAGHVRYLGEVPGPATDSVPFGCFDDDGTALGPGDFMVAYATVYLIPDGENQNPVIDGVLLDGKAVDPAAGITLSHCPPTGDKPCLSHALSAVIPESSSEADIVFTGEPSGGGGAAGSTGTASIRGENVWVEYYVTQGAVVGSRALVYDSESGKVNEDLPYRLPKAPGEGTLFAVVRDDRGGVNWWSAPLHIQ